MVRCESDLSIDSPESGEININKRRIKDLQKQQRSNRKMYP